MNDRTDQPDEFAFERRMWLEGATIERIRFNKPLTIVCLKSEGESREFECVELLGAEPRVGSRYSALAMPGGVLSLTIIQE